MTKKLLRVLSGTPEHPLPIWLMRQAGRYLPEYREIRSQVPSFLDLCLTPELAVEVTLQPLRRFGFDAAILFSDILVVPYALGQAVSFEEGSGPRLEALGREEDIVRLGFERFDEQLSPVYATIGELRQRLSDDTALIGFSGAPWTLATYMVEGGGSKDFAKVKTWAYADPKGFSRLIELLVDAVSRYLVRQVEAGAEALQIFDSWAGALPGAALRQWSLEPIAEIVRRVKLAQPQVPIIVFPRGVGLRYRDFAGLDGVECLALDWSLPIDWARDTLQPNVVVQGNLDPIAVMAGGDAMRSAVQEILSAVSQGPAIFNLGHGILPQTPIKHVEELVALVRSWNPQDRKGI